MASRKIHRIHDNSVERESRFQESELVHSPPGSNRKTRRPFDRTASVACVSYLAVLLVFVLLLFIVAVCIRFSGIHNDVPYTVTLGDTNLVGMDGFWCEEIAVWSDTTTADQPSPPRFNMSVYLLSRQPTLTARNQFTINGKFTVDQTVAKFAAAYGWYRYNYEESDIKDPKPDFVAWRFHLYPGSLFQLEDACVLSSETGGEATFLLIEGDELFERWLVSGEPDNSLHSMTIPSCSEGSGEFPDYRHTNNNDEDYYFVFHSKDSINPPEIQVVMHFNRFEYSVQNLNGHKNCTVTNTNTPLCVLHPQFYDFYALLAAQSDQDLTKNVTYGTTENFLFVCNPREISYAIIFFIPVLVLALLGGALLCFCLNHRRRRLGSYTILETPQAQRRSPLYSDVPPPYTSTPAIM